MDVLWSLGLVSEGAPMPSGKEADVRSPAFGLSLNRGVVCATDKEGSAEEGD